MDMLTEHFMRSIPQKEQNHIELFHRDIFKNDNNKTFILFTVQLTSFILFHQTYKCRSHNQASVIKSLNVAVLVVRTLMACVRVCLCVGRGGGEGFG